MRASWESLMFDRRVGGATSWAVSIGVHSTPPRVTPADLRLIADKLEAADKEAGDAGSA